MHTSGPQFLPRWELAHVGGTVVVVDVLRAFTTAAYAFVGGAREIWLVDGVEEAFALGRSLPGALLIGEDHGRRVAGFDFSNSPVEISESDVADRVLVQRTSAGTRGVVAAKSADRLLVGNLVCAKATANAIGDAIPTYVISGQFADDPRSGMDDLLTARFIDSLRYADVGDDLKVAEAVRGTPEAMSLDTEDRDHGHPGDVDLAVAVDRFNFAMVVDRVQEGLRLRVED